MQDWQSKLKGKVIVIVGGTGGIGATLARKLAAAGTSLVLAARGTEQLAALAAELRGMGATVLAVPTDITDAAQVANLFTQAIAQFGQIDALVNAACDVIGRVGLVAATNTRISRRAGLTPGAVYTMYDSKDELLIDAMRTLLGDAVNDNLAVTVHATDRSRMGEVSAHLLSRGGGEARRPWLRFRLEAYMAAMHRRDLAEVLSELHSEGVRRYEAMLGGVRLPEIIVALVALVGQSMPLGLSVLDRHFDGLESIDYRPVTVPLLNSLAAFALD